MSNYEDPDDPKGGAVAWAIIAVFIAAASIVGWILYHCPKE